MTDITRIQKIQQTQLYKSGEWFNAAKLAQSVSMPTCNIRAILAQNEALFDCKRVQGQTLLFRKHKPETKLIMRTKRFDWEGAETPRYY